MQSKRFVQTAHYVNINLSHLHIQQLWIRETAKNVYNFIINPPNFNCKCPIIRRVTSFACKILDRSLYINNICSSRIWLRDAFLQLLFFFCCTTISGTGSMANFQHNDPSLHYTVVGFRSSCIMYYINGARSSSRSTFKH